MRVFRLRSLLLSVVAIAIVYANVAVMLNLYLRRVEAALPLPEIARDHFTLFGVFSYYETTNQEMTIWGLARNPATGSTYWKQLPTAEYVPHLRGEQNGRLWASRHYGTLDREGHWRAWRFLGGKIFERYNRTYPHEPITELALQSMRWPRSPAGFYAARTPETESRQYWTVAP